jgi:hypothetical protein
MFVRSSTLDRPNDAARWRKTTEKPIYGLADTRRLLFDAQTPAHLS